MSLNPTTVTAEQAAQFFSSKSLASEAVSLLRHAHANSVLFDIGANSGYFSKAFLDNSRGFTGTIVLFEPIKNLIQIAVGTLSTYTKFTPVFVNSALGGSDGEIDLYLPKDSNIGWITAIAEKAQEKSPTRVRLAEAGKFIKRFVPDLVKVDIEGYESIVLKEFCHLIDDKYRPVFFSELGWGVSSPLWKNFMSVAAMFDDKGYVFIRHGGEAMTLTELSQLQSTINVNIVPQEKVGQGRSAAIA